jgi:hypothetical protein
MEHSTRTYDELPDLEFDDSDSKTSDIRIPAKTSAKTSSSSKLTRIDLSKMTRAELKCIYGQFGGYTHPIIKPTPPEDLVRNMEMIKTISSIDTLCHMKEQIRELQKSFPRSVMSMVRKMPYFDDIDQINNQIKMVMMDHPYYKFKQSRDSPIGKTDVLSNKNLLTSSTEKVNGYSLYNIAYDYFSYDEFEKIMKTWDDATEIDYETFHEWMSDEACTEWYKMDDHGDSYVGFWKFPEGSKEKKNAWQMTFDKNVKCLYDLPFGKSFLKWTINYGCSSGGESVRFSNAMGVWFTRKLKCMD